MLSEITNKLLTIGDSVLLKVKYDFNKTYSKYDFFKLKFQKNQLLKQKLSNQLYKKL
jgi:hypothetical protein